jgi:integrase
LTGSASYCFPSSDRLQWVCSRLTRETFRDYLLLLMFTGLRRTEAASLKWEHVDFSARTFTVIDPKNGCDHTLPTSDFLHELLSKRRQVAKGLYVFPSRSAIGHITEPRKQILNVCRESGVSFRAHDLRRTFAGIADSLDLPWYAIKKLLNHKTGVDPFPWTVFRLGHKRLSTGPCAGA